MSRTGVAMTESTFGPYKIEGLLGRGGMGEVYRAYDTSHDRVVALKLLAPHLSDDENYRARFRRECHLAARLREPHVIPIHRYGEIDGRLFLDMRIVEGRDVGSALAEGPMSPARAVDIIGQVARALDAAHDDGLIHRDVKPSNVLMAETDSADQEFVFVYLVDFGVARSTDENQVSSSLTQAGSAVGTFDYMPPERFVGEPADRRTDVYSLACLLHECLTASRPFSGTDLPALMYAHINRPIPQASTMVPGVPTSLDEVVAQGMAKDPAKRYQRAGDLAAAARAALKVTDLAPAAVAPATTIDPLPAVDEKPPPPPTGTPLAASSPPPPSGTPLLTKPPAPTGQPVDVKAPPPPTGTPVAASMPPAPVPSEAAKPPTPSTPGHVAPPVGTPVGLVKPDQPLGQAPAPAPPRAPTPPPAAWSPPVSQQSGPLPTIWPAPPPNSGAGTWTPPPPPPANSGAWQTGGNTPPPGGPGHAARPSRRPIYLIIGAAILVIAVAVGIVVGTSGGSGPTAAPTTTASTKSQANDFPTTTSASSSSAKPSGSTSSTALSAGQQKLISDLPTGYSKSNCTTSDNIESSTAALICTASTSDKGPAAALFYLFPNLADLQAALQSLIAEEGIPKTSAAAPVVGYRPYTFTSDPNTNVGNLATYVDTTTNTAQLAWSTEPDLELAVVAKPNSTTALQELYDWWLTF